MEIPLDAQVNCTDGVCGRSENVLIEALTDQVTHLVVKEDSFPNTEYLVPVDFMTETIDDTIRLRCSKAEMEKMDTFIITEFVEEKVPNYPGHREGISGMGAFYFLPCVISEITMPAVVAHQQIPPGELAVLYTVAPAWRRRMVM